MARLSPTTLLLLLGLGALGGCGRFGGAERPAWRAQAENACFAKGRVELSNYIQPASREIDGPSICGLTRPLKVTALQGGRVLFNSTQTLDCSMAAELDAWLADVVQPVARERFGQEVVQLDSMGSYNCRGMNNEMGARLSEHSFGNAIDIGGFQLADGRKITIVRDWLHGDPQVQAFLRDLHNGACGHFATVLSPGSNAFHYNHMHLDLANHGSTSTGPRRICKPAIKPTEPPTRKDGLPDAPEFDDDLDIAQSGPPKERRAYSSTGADLTLAAATIAAADSTKRKPAASSAPGPFAMRTQANAPRPPERGPGYAQRDTRAADRGGMTEDGVFTPEGRPADFDLPTSRFSR